MDPSIRTVCSGDITSVQRLEVAAGELFRGIGMDSIADDPPPTADELDAFIAAGRAWVAVIDSTVAGYLTAVDLDDSLHIEQVSVHPDFARRGVGQSLIDEAGEAAVRDGLSVLTLTTFRDVPWNAPYYARLGFTVVPVEQLTPSQRAIRKHEAEIGLDRWPRVFMARPLIDGRGSDRTLTQ